MPILNINLELRPDVIALPGQHEGINSFGNLQLGIMNITQAKVFNEQILLIHGPTHPIVYNLALEVGVPPPWLSGLVFNPLPPLVPPVPGPGVGPFIPGPAMGVVAPLPLAPLDPVTAAALLATHVPGGFGHFSNPSTIYPIQVSGSIVGLTPGTYSHPVYISAALTPAGVPRIRIAKFSVCLTALTAGYP